jgi:hypothetical protein
MTKSIIWVQTLLVYSFCGFLFDGRALSADNKVLERVLFDLKVEQQTIPEVLAEIEKKTGYEIDTDKPVQGTVTFEFKLISLQESIDRLFSGVNHSILFKEQEKKILILTFSEGGKSLASKPGLSNNNTKGKDLSSEGRAPMADASNAIDVYKETMKTGTKQELQSESSPMSAADKAIIGMKTGAKHESHPESSPMSASENAMKAYAKEKNN